MKKFILIFISILVPLQVLCELSGLLIPSNYPYGIVVISQLVVVLIGSVIAITRLKKKHNLVNFGKSLLAGSISIIISFILIIIMYYLFHFNSRFHRFDEISMLLGVFTLAQIGILLLVLMVAGMFYAFEKGGEKGYAIFIPIYNIIAMLRIAEKPLWWVFMFLIPIVNIIFLIKMLNGVSKNFGKSEGFTVGLVFLNGIFWAILGYGDAQYKGSNITLDDREDILDN